MTQVQTTLTYLRACIAYRNAGHMVSFTDDPQWLIDMAINRRVGWLDDPSHSRGSAMPINGKYPKKAEGDTYMHLWQLAHRINTPRLIVHEGELGEWRKLIRARLPKRIRCKD